MKHPALSVAACLLAVFLTSATVYSQSRTISKVEYDKAFDFAVTETNKSYPHIFTVITTFIENGKTVRTVIDVKENESPGHYRTVIKDSKNGRDEIKYQTTAGFGNVFCSGDGVNWRSSKYECYGPVMFYGAREAESIEYSVETKILNGKTVHIYREYSVFVPASGRDSKEFDEKISTIDSRGFFISVIVTEGTLGQKAVTLTRQQTWETGVKFKPVVAPK